MSKENEITTDNTEATDGAVGRKMGTAHHDSRFDFNLGELLRCFFAFLSDLRELLFQVLLYEETSHSTDPASTLAAKTRV